MPYIGNNLATQFQAFATQTITGDGSTGYTLDKAVANGKELLVYINNVKQEEGSGKSYTASGTTITFSAAVASTDSCYVVFLGSAVQTVTAPAGSIVSSQFSSADLVLPKTVTIGSAGAEDTKLVFDGNAQDFHIGLDDSADDLVIGKGSALGTTTHMSFDENGQVTKPLQCYFFVVKNADQSNISSSGSDVDITFETETIDIGNNFASNIFTAPVTGTYFLYTSLRLDNVDTAASYYNVKIEASNRNYRWIEHFNTDGGDYTYFTAQVTAIADMDAGDTAKVNVLQNGGTAQTDVKNDSARTYFSGYLLG